MLSSFSSLNPRSWTEFTGLIVSDPMVIHRSQLDNLERFACDSNQISSVFLALS